MTKAGQTDIRMRIVIEQPVPGVPHSLQDKAGGPLDPKCSKTGAPIAFDFPLRIAPGPKFFGDQVRSEGPIRRFVYIRIGQLAGEPGSPWSRRMKIDIHDIPQALLDGASQGQLLEGTICGTAKDGTPACATIRPVRWRLV
jgi:hypothetical protein